MYSVLGLLFRNKAQTEQRSFLLFHIVRGTQDIEVIRVSLNARTPYPETFAGVNICTTSCLRVEFLAAVTAAKHAKYLRGILLKLGYPQDGPTPLYEDNMSAINMINNRVSTERSRHIDIQHFAIQDWAKAKDIVMQHMPGILSIPDGLTKALG